MNEKKKHVSDERLINKTYLIQMLTILQQVCDTDLIARARVCVCVSTHRLVFHLSWLNSCFWVKP